MVRPYVTPGKTYGARSDARGVWDAQVVRVDTATNRAWLRVPRMTGDVERGPVEIPVLPVPIQAGDSVMVAFREGRKDSLVILSRVNAPPDGYFEGWRNIEFPYEDDDPRLSSWSFLGNEFEESVMIVDGALIVEEDYWAEFQLTNVHVQDPETNEFLFGSGIQVLKEPKLYMVNLVLKYRTLDDDEGSFYNDPVFRITSRGPSDDSNGYLPNGTSFEFEVTQNMNSIYDPETDEYVDKVQETLKTYTESDIDIALYANNFDVDWSTVEDASWVEEELDGEGNGLRFGHWRTDGLGDNTIYIVDRLVEFNLLLPLAAKSKQTDATDYYSNDLQLIDFEFVMGSSYSQIEIDLTQTILRVKQL